MGRQIDIEGDSRRDKEWGQEGEGEAEERRGNTVCAALGRVLFSFLPRVTFVTVVLTVARSFVIFDWLFLKGCENATHHYKKLR
jgi:hypothetical protein